MTALVRSLNDGVFYMISFDDERLKDPSAWEVKTNFLSHDGVCAGTGSHDAVLKNTFLVYVGEMSMCQCYKYFMLLAWFVLLYLLCLFFVRFLSLVFDLFLFGFRLVCFFFIFPFWVGC